MKLPCIRPLPKNKNSIIVQSQRSLYDTCFLNSNMGTRDVARLEKSVEKYEPDCIVVLQFLKYILFTCVILQIQFKFRKETKLIKYELFTIKCRYGMQVY